MLGSLKLVAGMAVRNTFRNWGRNRIIVIILVVALVLIELLLGFALGVANQAKEVSLDTLIGNLKYQKVAYKLNPSAKDTFTASDEFLGKIKNNPYVYGVTTRIVVPAIIKSERYALNVQMVGVDPSSEKDLSFLGKVYHGDLKKVLQDNNIIVGRELLKKLKTEKGFRLVSMLQTKDDKSEEIATIISDVYASSKNNEKMFVFMNINDLRNILKLPKNQVTEVAITLKDDKNLEAVYNSFKNMLPDGSVKLYDWKMLQPFIASWFSMMIGFLSIFFLLVFLATSIPLANTLLISVLERIYEFGLMQALGLRRFYIFLLIFFEGVILLVIGSTIGFIVGSLLTLVFVFVGIDLLLFKQGLEVWGAASVLHFYYDPYYAVILWLALLAIGAIIILYPALRTLVYTPIKALSNKG